MRGGMPKVDKLAGGASGAAGGLSEYKKIRSLGEGFPARLRTKDKLD